VSAMTRPLKRWPLLVVAVVSLIVTAARVIWPSLRFDETSLGLFGFAAVALLVALLPITRIKWGDFEAELDRDVDDLERKVRATEAAPPSASKAVAAGPEEPPSTPAWQRFFDEYIALVNSPASNVEKIIAAAILLEKMIDTSAAALGPEIGARARGPRFVIDRLAERNLITAEERAAFMDFWAIRNKVVHQGMQLTDEQTARLLDLVWRLVRTLA
jgi:uncharacterized protein YutE (UPF0331/DUF86 family)